MLSINVACITEAVINPSKPIISIPEPTLPVGMTLGLRLPHTLLGGLVGALSGPITPLAQCLLNVQDKFLEKNEALRFRWPGLLDVGANGLVVWFAITRLGTPLIWMLSATEFSLSVYGFYKGIQIAWRGNLSSIPKQLWHYSITHFCFDEGISNGQVEPKGSTILDVPAESNQSHLRKNKCQQITDALKGAALGSFAAITAPFVQIAKQIYQTPRKWPIVITQSINAYAFYVGGITVGKAASLALIKTASAVLGSYGVIRGAQIAIEEEPSKVLTFMWKPGFDVKNTAILTPISTVASHVQLQSMLP